MDVPLVKASGSHQELGYKHGQEFRELIKNHSRELLSGLNSRNALLTFSRNYLPFLERTAPHLLEELKGVSQGADVAFDEILALNLSPDFNGNKEGCTTFAISRQLMDDDDVLVAQNADYFPRTDDYTVLLQLTLPSGLRIATLTEAGTVGTAGMNSDGLVRVGNGLYSDQRALSGQPYYFLRRRMLEQESAEDALRVAREYPRSQPSGHLLADTSGRILYAEMLSEEDRVLEPTDGWIGHTNHFVHGDFRAVEKGTVEDSPPRLSTLSKLISSKPTHDLEEIEGILRNHENYPYSICRHEGEVEGLNGMGWKTNASLILRPKTSHLHVCMGSPCQNSFSEVRV
jgi:isopenicillin-N N-acyltransferase like protein